jgi:hypothetical protein
MAQSQSKRYSSGTVFHRPNWWKGKDDSEILMPVTYRKSGVSRWTGKQVEEIIFNCLQNSEYKKSQADAYFGGVSSAQDIMHKWNNDIRMFKECCTKKKPTFVTPARTPSWNRYCDYVRTEGVPEIHEELEKKYRVRLSHQNPFDCRCFCRCDSSFYDLFLIIYSSTYCVIDQSVLHWTYSRQTGGACFRTTATGCATATAGA